MTLRNMTLSKMQSKTPTLMIKPSSLTFSISIPHCQSSQVNQPLFAIPPRLIPPPGLHLLPPPDVVCPLIRPVDRAEKIIVLHGATPHHFHPFMRNTFFMLGIFMRMRSSSGFSFFFFLGRSELFEQRTDALI